MGEELGRVLDPSALDACDKPRGRLAIEVPAAWAGAEIDVAIPSRVACARCDGGGCDGCARRGGHRIDGDQGARTIRVRLPETLESSVVIRLVRPLGPIAEGGSGVEQLWLEARLGAGASAGVTLRLLALAKATDGARRPLAREPLRSARAGAIVAASVALAALVALALAAVGGR